MNKLSVKEMEYQGLACICVSNEKIEVIITTSVGPCILSFKENGKENVLVNTPDLILKTPSGMTCPIYGGHRLWVAPETYETTYFPDNQPLEISKSLNEVTLKQKDYGQPFLKSMSIKLQDKKVYLEHKITNLLPQKIACACWTITMFQPNGIAKIPMLNKLKDEAGLQPTQQINLWNYTNIGSNSIQLSKNEIQVKANLKEGNLKIGTPESTGIITYQLENQLFTKSFDANYEATFDKMSKAEIYCCPNYIELEAIGEKHELKPNESATFSEFWEID